MKTSSQSFVHRFVPAPDGRAEAPTLLLLHGTGGNEDDLLDLGRTLSPDSALLSPRGQVSENGMPRFFRRLAEGVFDEADLIRRTDELANFVQASSKEYGFDAGNVVAVGYSNGANIAASTLLLLPGVLKGAVLLRAMVPLVPPQLPSLAGTSVFLAAGQSDSLVRPENTAELADMFRRAGADVTLQWTPAGHQLASQDIAAAQKWVSQKMAR